MMTQVETAPDTTQVDDESADAQVLPDCRTILGDWLAAFDAAASAGDVEAVIALFGDDPWWRDLVALTWDVTAMHGADEFRAVLGKEMTARHFGKIALDLGVEPALMADTYIEGIFRFSTDVGLGRGGVRLMKDADGTWKGWTVSTSLDALKDHPETVVTISDAARDEHNEPTRPGARPSWQENEARRREFRHSDPSVLIIGAGHSGVFLAARLGKLGVPTLLVDTYARAGDNWRLRYSNLMLHDTKWYSQFPYMPYPETWPLFTPKEMLADWIEAYVKFLQLNLWTSAYVQKATYDTVEKRWTIEIDHDGERRTLQPNHLVFATGIQGVPTTPAIAGVDDFRGQVLHSTQHEGGEGVKGKKIIVVGTGASGCDVAQDAYENGATVTMVQRSATYVLSQRNGVPVFHGQYYSEVSPGIEEADLLATSMPMALVTQVNPAATRIIAEADADLLRNLAEAGFETTLGPNDAGMMYMALVKGGGYYIDKGAARLIIDGEIRLQHGEIDHFTESGVVYRDGTAEAADLVVFSTGFTNMREATRPIVGDAVADQLGLVWGIDEQGELRTTFRHSGHEKLWFMAGGFQQSRVHSKHLALMIKAMDEGMIDPGINVARKTTAL